MIYIVYTVYIVYTKKSKFQTEPQPAEPGPLAGAVERHRRHRGRPPDGGRGGEPTDRPTGVPPSAALPPVGSACKMLPSGSSPTGRRAAELARQRGVLSVHRPLPPTGGKPAASPDWLHQSGQRPLLCRLCLSQREAPNSAFAVVFAFSPP